MRGLRASPVSSACLVAGLGLLISGGLDALADEALALGADDGQDTLQRAAPDHQTALDLGPLLLAEYTVGGAVDKELGAQLRELALDQTGADGVNDPHLNVGGGDTQGRGNGGVGERARGGGSRQRGEGQETHLGLQSIGGLGEHAAGDRSERGGANEGLVGVEGVGGEDLQQLEERAVAGAERLHGIGGSQGSEVENGRAAQRRSESADSQVASGGLGGVGRGDSLEGLDNVRLGQVVITGRGGRIGDRQVQFLALLVVQLPRGQPCGQLRCQLGFQCLKGVSGSRLADDCDNGQENVVTAGIVGGQSVEDGGEDGDGQSRAELGRGGDGLSEVGANARKENVRVGGLVDEVDEQVVGGSDFCNFSIEVSPRCPRKKGGIRVDIREYLFSRWPHISSILPLTLLGGTVQGSRSPDELLQNLIALLEVGLALGLFLLADRLEERGDLGLEGLLFAEGVDVLGELLGELGERTLDEEGVGRSGHDVLCGRRRGEEERFFDGGVYR